MNLIRQEGKTIEEAIEIALEKLGIKEEEADVKVVDEGSKGILGLIGARNAVVEVKVKVNPVQIG
ncbi:MAG: protein jag, partial [Halanaerobiaceae bacterium]|nr:protein jag [Halanaerobiaceae bacterium]